jgi:hypothetical protein
VQGRLGWRGAGRRSLLAGSCARGMSALPAYAADAHLGELAIQAGGHTGPFVHQAAAATQQGRRAGAGRLMRAPKIRGGACVQYVKKRPLCRAVNTPH